MLFILNVDSTPNPNALKFVLNERLLRYETRQFHNIEEAKNDPLAKGIFEITGVVSVFYMDKCITIEKSKDANWGQIQKPFINFLKIFDRNLIPSEDELKPPDENTDELLKKINELLDNKVRPALAGDGGGLQVMGIDRYTVKIHYQGACGSCPTAISGTLMAIEGLLKQDIHPAIEVVAA